jgi:hypothetical protein
MRAFSRGYMKLNPNNPYHDPIIQPNYFEHPQDIIDLREAVKIARNVFAQKAMEPFRGAEIAPGNIFCFLNGNVNKIFYVVCLVLRNISTKNSVQSVILVLGSVCMTSQQE